MSTSTHSSQDYHPGDRPEPFHEPKTMPSGWNLSELTSPSRGASDNGRHQDRSAKGSNEARMAGDETTNPVEVSFSDWHLSQNLDQFENPGSNHFSAF